VRPVAAGQEADDRHNFREVVDTINVDLVPAILGDGVRWFENLGKAPVRLDNPTVIEGDRVTHLRYTVSGHSA
jgi:hypothetical protein